MAVARACIYHSLPFDLRHLLGATLRPERGGPEADREVARFEADVASHVGRRHAVAFSLARSAVHHALLAADLAPGSEVVLPPISIKPMVDAVLSAGMVPVFVDLDPATLLFDLDELRAALGPRTGAIVLTPLFGIASDPRPAVALAREVGALVIEDFSHNLGATVDGRQHGTFGDVGVYSCSATKTLDAYGGGLALTDDDHLADALRRLRDALPPPPPERVRTKIARDLAWNLGSRALVWTLVGFPLVRALRRWSPDTEAAMAGAASAAARSADGRLGPEAYERMSGRQARAGRHLLPKVVATDEVRRANAQALEAAYRHVGAAFPAAPSGARSVHWQSVVYVDDVERARARFARAGIDTATTNLSLLPELGLHPAYERPCPAARRVREHALYVPSHPRLSRAARARVARAVVEVLGEVAPGDARWSAQAKV